MHHFFNVSDRINYVNEVQRTMWESRGIGHDLGRYNRQRVHEHYSSKHLPKGANPRFIVTALAREAVVAQELYETI